MCDFCKKNENIDSGINNLKIRIKNNILDMIYYAYSCDSSFEVEIPINYCMICGEKLSN